jgi:hypothetical protein
LLFLTTIPGSGLARAQDEISASPAGLERFAFIKEIPSVEVFSFASQKGSGFVLNPLRILTGSRSIQEKLTKASGVELTGFYDVTLSAKKGNPHTLQPGALEIDFARPLAHRVQSAAAIVSGPDNTVQLSVAFLDYHFGDGLIAPRGRIFIEKGIHIQAGRFDLPFGNDWNYLASKDRLTVTPPLTTDFVLDGGYNSWGIRVMGASSYYNYSAVAVRGITHGAAIGGRFGLTPFTKPYTFERISDSHPLELGFSYLQDASSNGDVGDHAFAVDFDAKFGLLHVMAEYVQRYKTGSAIEGSSLFLSGFHVTGEMNAQPLLHRPLALLFRVERLSRRISARDSILEMLPDARRASIYQSLGGAAYRVNQSLLLKFEYQRCFRTQHDFLSDAELPNSSAQAQFVISF